MNTLVFVVKGQMITRTDNLLPVAKCRNLYRAKFDFKTANWDGTKTALFKMGNTPKAVILDENDECDVPWEFFDAEETAYGTVSVFCGDLVTANKESVLVMQSGYEQSEASKPPTPDIYNQILEVVDDTKQIAQSVRDDADKGLFNGKDGDDGKSAYEIAVSLGFVGSEQQWIDSLRYDHSDEFAQLAEQVRQALETEGNRQNNAIVEMGTEQKEAITNEGTLQKKSVTDAGEEQVEFITEEGNKQTKAVADEGTKQLEAVNKAVEGIVADREQITQNKEDITTLKEEVTALDNTKADGIIETASGEIIKTEISSDSKLTGLKVFGKSEQVATTGKNLLSNDVLDRVYPYIEKGVAIDRNEDGTLSLHGTVDDVSNLYINFPIFNVVSGRKYTGQINQTNIRLTTKGSLEMDVWDNEKAVTVAATATEPIKNVYLVIESGKTVNYDSVAFMIEEGEVASPYEPYTGGKPSPSPDYPQEIKSVGDKGNIEITISGKNLAEENNRTANNIYSKPILLKTGVSYVLSSTREKTNLYFDDVTQGTNLLKGYAIKQLIYTPSEDVYAKVHMYEEKGVLEKDYIQLEIGTMATDFEPYKPPQTLTLLTPNGLPGMKVRSGGNHTDENGQQWVCDEIDCEKGEYIKRIDCAVLDGVNIKFSDSGPESLFWNGTMNTLHDVNEKIIGMSNYLNERMFAFNGNYDFVFLYKEKALEYFDTVEQFNSFLEQKNAEGNPVKIYYSIENPVKQKLSQKEIEAFKSLHTNYPTTIITNDENTHMEVSYVADTKNYIEKTQQPLKKQIAELQNALISQKISGGDKGN